MLIFRPTHHFHHDRTLKKPQPGSDLRISIIRAFPKDFPACFKTITTAQSRRGGTGKEGRHFMSPQKIQHLKCFALEHIRSFPTRVWISQRLTMHRMRVRLNFPLFFASLSLHAKEMRHKCWFTWLWALEKPSGRDRISYHRNENSHYGHILGHLQKEPNGAILPEAAPVSLTQV